jgi:polysaccharide biosynthesis protein PslF
MNTDNRKLNTKSNFAFASGTGQVPKPKETAIPSALRGLRIAHLGTYPPRQCGIATYTQDVVTALHANTEVAAPVVIAMVAPDENPIQTGYGWPVHHLIRQDHPEEYREIARTLKSSDIDLINIQYEHGIFGGSHGNMLNEFLDELAGAIPVTVTFHTVLPNPDPELAQALREVALRVDEIIVLNSRAIPLLKNAYNIPTHNVSVIPHGTPNVERSRRPLVRSQFDVQDQTVLSTFGLISPGKGCVSQPALLYSWCDAPRYRTAQR